MGLQRECCREPWVKCADVADEIELAYSSPKSLKQNHRMGLLFVPQHSGNGLVLAHRERNGLRREALAWACSGVLPGTMG